MATLKPTTPLHTPNKAPLKPPSPLLPKTAAKTPISHAQRRWRFHSHTGTSQQRRQGFQITRPPRLRLPDAARVGGSWLRPPWAATTPPQENCRIQFPHGTNHHQHKNRRISTIRTQTSTCAHGNCMRNCWLTAIDGHQGNAPSNIREGPTGAEGTGGTRGPGRGAGGRRRGQGGPRDRPLRAKLACGDLAGGPPPTGTHSGPAHQGRPRGRPGPRHPETRGATQQQPAPHSNTQCPLTRGLS